MKGLMDAERRRILFLWKKGEKLDFSIIYLRGVLTMIDSIITELMLSTFNLTSRSTPFLKMKTSSLLKNCNKMLETLSQQ